MADRVTKKQIAQLFTVFCNTGGFRMAHRHGESGLALDYYAIGGGWQIIELKAGSGGVSTPFGSRRYKPREFRAVLAFAVDVLQFRRGAYDTGERINPERTGQYQFGGGRAVGRVARRMRPR